MSTKSQRQGLERGVFLSLISSRRKELMSRSPNNGRFWGKRWRPHFRLREWEEEGAGHEGRDRETAWPLLAMGSWEPVRDRHPSTQDPWFGEGSTRWIPVPPPLPFRSVAQSCPTLCNPMNRSTPGLPVHHQLLEFTQTHVHQVGDAIQLSHPLSSPSPPAPNPSQHQGLFQ